MLTFLRHFRILAENGLPSRNFLSQKTMSDCFSKQSILVKDISIQDA